MTYAADATPPFYHGTRADPHPPERLKEMKGFLARLAAEGDMRIID